MRSSSDERTIFQLLSSSSGPTARSSLTQMCTWPQSSTNGASSSWQRSGVVPPASARWNGSPVALIASATAWAA